MVVKGLTTPLLCWLQGSYLFVQVLGDLCVVSYWIDTLVLKNSGKYLRYFAASPFPLQGKTNACSRGSKKDFWRRCRGGLRQVKSRFDLPSTCRFLAPLPRRSTPSEDIPSTHHKLFSLSSPPLLKRFSKTFAFSSPSSRMYLCLCFHVPSICLHLCLLKIY